MLLCCIIHLTNHNAVTVVNMYLSSDIEHVVMVEYSIRGHSDPREAAQYDVTTVSYGHPTELDITMTTTELYLCCYNWSILV